MRPLLLVGVGATFGWMLYSTYIIGYAAIANYELVVAFAGWAP